MGATTITLNNGEGANFNTTTLQDISIGAAENAKVMNVTADIAHDRHKSRRWPAIRGSCSLSRPIRYVCVVTWITYSLGADNVLYIDAHQGQGNQAVAQDISAMTLSAGR